MTTELPGLWFLSRASGLVLLVLLSVTLALGIVATGRRTPSWWPRFATASLHANIALLSIACLVAHILTTVVDEFVPIGWVDVVVPFRSAYRPVWLGLGTVAGLLLIAVVVTASLRQMMSPQVWRRTHYLVYAAWPISVMHGLGTGSDTTNRVVLLLTFGCVLMVTVATVVRLSLADGPRWLRSSGRVAAVLLPVLLGVWLGSDTGPLEPGWADRSGTPSSEEAP